MKNFKALSNEQMLSVKGGRLKSIKYEDRNGDGRLDKVITIYDNRGNLKRETVKYG